VRNVLEQIVDTKWIEIRAAQNALPRPELERQLADAPAVRDFFGALCGHATIQLIAEVKKASPSAGVIRLEFDPKHIARIYAANGARCLSVLTDRPYFQGSLDDLRAVRAAVDAPLLRKDFILDPYQLVEARVAGADAVLLIAECLDDCRLRSLLRESLDLQLCPLVECYEPENVPRAIDAGATLIGINNRNLKTFATDLEHTIRLRHLIPSHCVLVSESGIRCRADAQRLQEAGVEAMLVGEHLMSQPDIGAAVRDLLGRQ
jgi:indole-3-glycerol phosphate synthase